MLTMMAAMVTTLAACAPSTQWTRDSRVCEAGDPPRVCFDADPDSPATLRVGGAELVPGECAFAPRPRGGSLRVEVRDGRDGEGPSRRISVGRGRTTWVRAHGSDLDLDVERSGCDARPTSRP